jgi:hypothetical protein
MIQKLGAGERSKSEFATAATIAYRKVNQWLGMVDFVSPI